MLKPGIYVAKNDENIWDSYMIRMEVKETEKSYVFKLVDFQSRYSAAHIEMLFEKSNKFILRKNKGGHAMRIWGDDNFTFYPYQAGIPYFFELSNQ